MTTSKEKHATEAQCLIRLRKYCVEPEEHKRLTKQIWQERWREMKLRQAQQTREVKDHLEKAEAAREQQQREASERQDKEEAAVREQQIMPEVQMGLEREHCILRYIGFLDRTEYIYIVYLYMR